MFLKLLSQPELDHLNDHLNEISKIIILDLLAGLSNMGATATNEADIPLRTQKTTEVYHGAKSTLILLKTKPCEHQRGKKLEINIIVVNIFQQ